MFAFARSRTSLVGPALSAMLAVAGITTESQAVITHQYLFNSGDGTQILDSVGGAHGEALTYVDGVMDTPTALVNTSGVGALVLNGADQFGRLPAGDIAINTYTEVTLELWMNQTGNANQFTFAAGLGRTADGTVEGEGAGLGFDYLMLQPTRGPGDQGSRGALSDGTFDSEVGVTDGPRDLNDSADHQIVMTVDATNLAYYVDGEHVGTADLAGKSLADVSNDLAYLGKALYNDPYFIGSIYEFNIYDNALTDVDVAANYTDGCSTGYDCTKPITLTVDRATGVATLSNEKPAFDLVSYEIASAAGALSPADWNSIADTGDSDSGGSIDPDDQWSVVNSTSTSLSEEEPIGGGGPDDGAAVGGPFNLGALWTPSPFEDLVMSASYLDESFLEQPLNIDVEFVGDAISRADFNADGVIDAADYAILRDNHLQTIADADPTAYETYLLGDMDGDFDNDFDDFRLFKNQFIAANGAAAFAALGAVPEPSTALMVFAAVPMALARRKRQC